MSSAQDVTFRGAREARAPRSRPDPHPIPFHRAALTESDIEAVVATLRSGWLTTGPRCADFERALELRLGRRHALALNSATSALFLLYKAAGVGPGDEVLVPAITFMATAEVAIHLGARPVIVDVDETTLLIDPADLAKKLSPRSKLVAPVHFAGQPCDMAPLLEIAAAERLAVVEDAAHCLTGSADGRRPGAGTVGAALSFYATKEIALGEGGALVSDDPGVVARARRWSLHGISRPAHARMQIGARAISDVEDVGYKMNLPDVLAALGVSQLLRIDSQRERREQLARRYDAALARIPGVRPLPHRAGYTSAHHLYVVRIDPAAAGISRDEIAHELGARGIGTSVHFTPLHEMTVMKTLYATRSDDCPVAARAGREILSLPLHPLLTDGEVDEVAAKLRSIVEAFAP
jgi:dTDP-4-amino-4,6-dideoxygalactose transaminase